MTINKDQLLSLLRPGFECVMGDKPRPPGASVTLDFDDHGNLVAKMNFAISAKIPVLTAEETEKYEDIFVMRCAAAGAYMTSILKREGFML